MTLDDEMREWLQKLRRCVDEKKALSFEDTKTLAQRVEDWIEVLEDAGVDGDF